MIIRKEKNMKSFYVVIVLMVVIVISGQPMYGDTSFYTSEDNWRSQASGPVEQLITTSVNVALADEVASPPGTNAQLGNVLTFRSSNTGLSLDFQAQTMQPGAGFTFNDTETRVFPFTNALSVGDVNDYEDDDWRVEILSGNIYGFGILLGDNFAMSGEFCVVYGADGTELGTTTNIPGSAYTFAFLGVLTDQPITAIEFREGSGPDDISIANFSVVIPEPCTFSLLVLGGVVLARRRKQ